MIERSAESNDTAAKTAGNPRGSDEPIVAASLMRSVEALLMAAEGPLSVDRLVKLIETTRAVERSDVRVALDALATRYADAAIDLVEVAGGWRFQVGSDYAVLVSRLWEERPPKLSRAMLETLALICYRQPITRSDIEAVRGVSVSTNIVKTLQEFEWIKVVGYRDMPGRPALFGTTSRFLDDFGLQRLSDLPPLPELKELDALDTVVARLQADYGDLRNDPGDSASGEAGAPDGHAPDDDPDAATDDKLMH